MRTMTILIERNERAAAARMKAGFVRAMKTGRYQGEFRSFQSPAALFRVLTPVRWTVIEQLQALGPMSLRGLARALGRDVKSVHRDASTRASAPSASASGERMRCAIDSSLQRHVVREILVAVSRGRPVGADLARVLPQRPRGFESRFPARHPVPLGVMVSLERGDAVAVSRDEGPYRVPIHRSSVHAPARVGVHASTHPAPSS